MGEKRKSYEKILVFFLVLILMCICPFALNISGMECSMAAILKLILSKATILTEHFCEMVEHKVYVDLLVTSVFASSVTIVHVADAYCMWCRSIYIQHINPKLFH